MPLKKSINRRSVLRGMFGGAAISVGLPILDCFLNENGTAYADGVALPTCFATWFCGLGFTPGFWEPKVIGSKYEMEPLLAPLTRYKEYINIFSGLTAHLDGKPAAPHETGPKAILTGDIPRSAGAPLPPSIDSLIADSIGTRTRFRSLEVACDGSAWSYSRRGGSIVNASESSPLALYQRVFGPDFKDPNAAEYTPDPRIVARRSVLSIVGEQRQQVMRSLGAADRARLDEFYTSLRSFEQQLDLSLQKPEPMAACSMPTEPAQGGLGTVIDDAAANHKLFAQLLAHALACGQTRVANVVMSSEISALRMKGSSQTYHMYTHEEAIDPAVGYQPMVHDIAARVVSSFATFLETIHNYREGDSTLLDRMAIFYSTDNGYAKLHSLTNIPLITAGRAGGRLKGGQHLQFKGDTVTRVGLTLQQALGVSVNEWGTDSNRTSKTITEILA